jgi:hypothetical protein
MIRPSLSIVPRARITSHVDGTEAGAQASGVAIFQKPRNHQGDAGEGHGGLFIFRPQNTPLSTMAMAMLLRRMKAEIAVHGFRSSFRD